MHCRINFLSVLMIIINNNALNIRLIMILMKAHVLLKQHCVTKEY